GFEPRLATPKDPVLPLHHPRPVVSTLPATVTRFAPVPQMTVTTEMSASVTRRHGLPDQEAPQAHAQEEAQEAVEEDPLAATPAGPLARQSPSRRRAGRPARRSTRASPGPATASRRGARTRPGSARRRP